MTFIFYTKLFSLISCTYKRKVFLPVPLNLIRSFRWSQKLTFSEEFRRKIIQFSPVINDPQLQYFRNYLINNSDCYPSIFIPEKISLACNNRALKLLRDFKTNDEDDTLALVEINNCLKEDLKNMSENDLLELSYLFANISFKCPKLKALEIVKTLNYKILEEVYPLSIDENLRLIDVLFSSQLYLIFGYVWKAISKYCFRVSSLNPKQVVHLAYLLSKFSRLPCKEGKFHFQDVLNSIIPKLNPNELGIICYSMRKMQLVISHPEFYTSIVNVLLPNIESLNDQNLISVSEALSISKSFNSISSIQNLQEQIIQHFNKFSLSALISVALSGVGINYVNQPLVLKIIDKAREDLSQCSILFFQRLAFIMAKFNITESDEFLKDAVEVVKTREYNFFKNYNSLVNFTKYLICMDVLDKDLIKIILDKEKVAMVVANKSYKTVKLTLGFIDNTVELQMPDYGAPRLSEGDKKKIWRAGKAFFMTVSKNSLYFSKRAYDSIMWKFQDDLCTAYGPKLSEWKRVIYCEPPTLVFRFDKNLTLQSVPEEYKTSKSYICKPLDDDHIWSVLFVGSFNHLNIDQDIDLITRSQLRLYEKIGYKPIFIFRKDYINHMKSENFKSFFEKTVKCHLEKFCN